MTSQQGGGEGGRAIALVRRAERIALHAVAALVSARSYIVLNSPDLQGVATQRTLKRINDAIAELRQ